MKKEIRAWLILAVLQLTWIIPVTVGPVHEPAKPEPIETETELIQWKVEEVTVQPMEIESVSKPQLVSLGEFKLTAYCPCENCTSDGDGITASGTVATQGRTVAVDPSIIPYGTVLIINGHEYIAEDSGGKWIQGKEIDIFFDSHQEALEFGVQYAEVFVYENLQNLAE